jgi:hypothetical protein
MHVKLSSKKLIHFPLNKQTIAKELAIQRKDL